LPDEGDLVPTWADFEKAESEMAAAGWRLLSRPGSGFGYPAAVRRDGRLRLHPIPRFPAAGRRGPSSFLCPSWRMCREGRYVLPSGGAEDADDEFYPTGRAAPSDARPGG
jgi:hypothetical protein